MQGRPSDETIRAFTRKSRESERGRQRVAAQYGFDGQVLLIDGQGSEEASRPSRRWPASRA